jgi:hypothetical protein
MHQRTYDALRPFTITRWRRSDGFLILWNGAGRWFAWLPVATRRTEKVVAVGEALFDLRTGGYWRPRHSTSGVAKAQISQESNSATSRRVHA